MAERDQKIRPDALRRLSRCSLIADGMLLATFTGSLAADRINDLKPHIFDTLSPQIEDHIGNSWPSFVAACGLMKLSQEILQKLVKEETMEKVEPILPIATVLCVAGLNILVELQKKPNPEFNGDVIVGVVAGAFGTARVLLPEKVEDTIARMIKRRIGNFR